jgi:hypothetical protein
MILINTALHNYVYYRNSIFVDHLPPCYAKVSIKYNCMLVPYGMNKANFNFRYNML